MKFSVLVTACLYAAPMIAETFEQRVVEVLKATPLVDGHNDIPWAFRKRVNNRLDRLDLWDDLSRVEPPTHTDIPRLVKGQVGGQFWSVYVPIREYGGGSEHTQLVIEQIDFVHRLVDRYPETFELAYTASDVRRIHAGGKIASLIGLEGGHAINDSLAVLRRMYQLGARYMTLTHTKGLRWADSATDIVRHNGLTSFGEAVVREMNRLGMLVDLSHTSADTMRDAMRVSEAPIIFSHSSAYTLVPHPRNVPDDVLELVSENQGVVMVTFYPSYVSERVRRYGLDAMAERQRLQTEFSEEEASSRLNEWQQANPAPRPTLAQVADHIDHIHDVVGIDHIGIGADYDGMPPGPIGLEDVSKYPALFVELLKRGYSDDDIAKIAGGNILRVMQDVELVAKRIAKRRLPSMITIEEVD
ncbi:MAG: membrane dipeptidase [Gammaproteobacteria bacterium]|nr:MAG: membrane dipeptidase [Gammaproteobacteria bacterium]